MKESIITGVVVAVMIIGGIAAYMYGTAPSYRNETHRFSIELPKGFSAREVAAGAASTEVVVIDNGKGDGLQIVITPFGKDVRELTAESIHATIPDLQISNSEVVKIGELHSGLMFTSDNESFDGASRELWFVFNSVLYQVATYERLSPLLRGIIAHWQFF